MPQSIKCLVGSLFIVSAVWGGRVRAEEASMGKELEALKSRVQHLEEAKESPLVSLNAVMAGHFHSITIDQASESRENVSRGVFVFQPEVSVVPSENDEFFFKFGFAGGKGAGAVSPFHLSTWAAGGEDDVVDINGRSRDYLLTSWYKRTLSNGVGRLEISGGIIDATDYLDENAFANDEFSQFMNEALVNGPHVFSPSYDVGGAIRLEGGAHSLNGVAMSVGKNEAGKAFSFYGAQYAFHVKTPIGEGNYRLIFETTDKKFPNVGEDSLEARQGAHVSCDQELGGGVGGWIRFGTQDDAAAVHCKNIYSGGVHLGGKTWGRPSDNVGVGHALLRGGNDGHRQSEVTEAYLHVQLNETLAFNLDAQRLRDSFESGAGTGIRGWVSSLMVVSRF